ncbi:MAG: DUF2169 domain-containing protein [Pseudomonadota bacterium]|nr:DUF2169 domain-containing protein [Pseudomonadota bacterium]
MLEEEKILLPGQTPAGEYILSVLVKRSYSMAGERLTALPLVKGDSCYDHGDPRITAIEFETDLIPFKLATDIIFIGNAYAPDAVESLTATLQVGAYQKDILVIGDRYCQFNGSKTLPSFTEPQPFTEMPIRYERAYGGVDIYAHPELSYPYPRNPLGKGFVLNNNKQAIQNLPLPNIEDPLDPLTPERLLVEHIDHWSKQPFPQSLGWYPKYCQPRAGYAGILPADKPYADQMRAAYRPLVPPEQQALYEQTELPIIDFKFFNGASSGLVVPYLQGNEIVTLSNLTPEGKTTFTLAAEKPTIHLDIGFGAQQLEVVLHTLTLRQVEQQFDLVWRGALAYPGPTWLPQMQKLELVIL